MIGIKILHYKFRIVMKLKEIEITLTWYNPKLTRYCPGLII